MRAGNPVDCSPSTSTIGDGNIDAIARLVAQYVRDEFVCLAALEDVVVLSAAYVTVTSGNINLVAR